MKKYFVTSDIHSFYKPFIEGLNRAGFDINNDDHILIVCGDLFDRGPDAVKLFNWIRALPKNRRILIRGNHEYLFLDLLKNCAFAPYDYTNGTYDTFCDLNRDGLIDEAERWIKSDEWVNYYELNNYIFVHSFIPIKYNDLFPNLNEYNPNWRECGSEEYANEASWGCPWKKFKDGLFDEEIKNNKILVCGHWHTSDFFNVLANDYHSQRNNPIYVSKNLIALDACTALTHGVNILTIENDKITCYNYNDNKKEN